jgi:hypothetical protein
MPSLFFVVFSPMTGYLFLTIETDGDLPEQK